MVAGITFFFPPAEGQRVDRHRPQSLTSAIGAKRSSKHRLTTELATISRD
jgi:hypothetical protein